MELFVANNRMIRRTTILLIFMMLTCSGAMWAEYTDHRNRGVDSLEYVLRNDPPREQADMIRLYDGLAWGYLEMNEEKSTQYAHAGLAVAEKINAYKSICNFHRILAMHHWANARYAEAEKELQSAQEAVGMMHECGNYDDTDIDDQASALYGTLGNLYNTLGQGAKALDYYHRALRLFAKHDWKESQVVAYYNMAELYYCMGNMSRAMDYLQKSDSIAVLSQDSLMESLALEGMAKVAKNEGKYDDARKYMQQVYDYLFAHPGEEGGSRSDCLVTMTDIAIEEGNWDEAEKLICENEALGEELHRSDAAFLNQKASLAAHDERWEEAEKYAMQAADVDTDAPDVARETYKLLADIYTHLNNPELAQLYNNKEDSIQAAWSNYAYQASLTEQEILFETEKKDMELANMMQHRRMLIIIVAIGGVLLIVMVFVMIISRRNHQRQKARLTLETEVREREIIARDLHDGLGGMLSLLKLKIANKEQDEAMHLVDESAREMRRVAHHIMPVELQQDGLITSLKNYAISVPGAHFQYYTTDTEEGPEKRFPSDIEIVLYRCAYELVNNAIKHSSTDRIDIQLMNEEKQVVLTVSDKGKGFHQEQEMDGTGLRNIRKRIAQFNGEMNIISQPGNGTEINIAFPL